MAPPRHPTTENSSSGLVLLEDEHIVVVTGEEHHQDTLACTPRIPTASRGTSPRNCGRPRSSAVGTPAGPASRCWSTGAGSAS